MHSEIARRKCRGLILGAGFIQLIDDRAVCGGMSESLHIGARPEDQDLLDEWLAELAAETG